MSGKYNRSIKALKFWITSKQIRPFICGPNAFFINFFRVQIRRGDKIGNESRYFTLNQYMFFVINYYKKLALKGFSGEKFVFVASDDSNAIQELRNKYKDFKFIDKKFYFNKTEINGEKYSPNNLLHTIIDTHFLARSDFLVCTMSSNVRNDILNVRKN